MKTVATIIFIIFLGITAQAQTANTNLKVETIEKTIVTESTYSLKVDNKTDVARLYRFKNSRIKKELNFITKADKPKMA